MLTDAELFDGQKQRFLLLDLQGGIHIPAILRAYPRCNLVFLVRIHSEEEFIAFSSIYSRCTVWAEEALQDYHDEYYQISQMNNQLINSQRALTKANQQYRRLLQQVHEANNLISVLEQDELTGLLRLPALYRRAQQIMEAEPGRAFDMIAVNFHSIRTVNELFGRETGDRLLKDFALFLAGQEHADQGLLAHAAGSVFLLFLPSELHFHAQLRQKASAWLSRYPLPLQLRVRIGVCTSDDSSTAAEALYDRARLALDTLKQDPGQQLAFYTEELHRQLLLRHKLMDNIPTALTRHEILLYLQPKVRLEDGAVVGAEALVRWQHPELGLSPLSVSVNMARSDFYQPDLLDFLKGLLLTYDLAPEQLHLEVLERAYVQDSAHLCQVLTDLRRHGFVIEMDYFGVGESSLAMLADMPIDIIKLDRQFLLTAEQNTAHIEVIRCIIQLAEKLNIGIIAEGVETPQQAELLRSLGCGHAQGYLYGRPEPAEHFLTP